MRALITILALLIAAPAAAQEARVFLCVMRTEGSPTISSRHLRIGPNTVQSWVQGWQADEDGFWADNDCQLNTCTTSADGVMTVTWANGTIDKTITPVRSGSTISGYTISYRSAMTAQCTPSAPPPVRLRPRR